MKILIFVTLLTCSLPGGLAGESARVNTQKANGAGASVRHSKGAGVRAFTLEGQGIALTLPAGWRRDAEENEGEYRWSGPGGAELSITVSSYRPEYGGRPAEEETEEFFKAHKEGGSQDVRFLEIDGVRGVHFIVDDEVWKLPGGKPREEFYRFIQWSAQRAYKGKRQVVTVSASAPVQSFSAHRDALYGVLASLKFLRD